MEIRRLCQENNSRVAYLTSQYIRTKYYSCKLCCMRYNLQINYAYGIQTISEQQRKNT